MGDNGGCRHRHCPSHHQGPAAVYLHQHLTRGGVEVFDPPEEIPSGPEFIHQLPERTRWAEETAFISEIFDHTAQAHKHLSSVCANISALAKITNKTTLLTIINEAVRPLVQINIPEGFLNPVEDRWPKMTEEEERWEKVQKMVLPVLNALCLSHKPKNSPHPYTSSSGLVEAEPQVLQWGDGQRSMRQVRGESQTAVQSADGEEVPWWYTSKEMQGHRRTSSLKKEGRHLKRWTYYDNTLQCIQRKTIVSPSLHKSSQHLISASHPASAPSSSTGGTRWDS